MKYNVSTRRQILVMDIVLLISGVILFIKNLLIGDILWVGIIGMGEIVLVVILISIIRNSIIPK